jgi:hypothetical protein
MDLKEIGGLNLFTSEFSYGFCEHVDRTRKAHNNTCVTMTQSLKILYYAITYNKSSKNRSWS